MNDRPGLVSVGVQTSRLFAGGPVGRGQRREVRGRGERDRVRAAAAAVMDVGGGAGWSGNRS